MDSPEKDKQTVLSAQQLSCHKQTNCEKSQNNNSNKPTKTCTASEVVTRAGDELEKAPENIDTSNCNTDAGEAAPGEAKKIHCETPTTDAKLNNEPDIPAKLNRGNESRSNPFNSIVESQEFTPSETLAETTTASETIANSTVIVKQDEDDDDDYEDDDDGDPIPSGTGTVSKECSPSELIGWSEVLPKWHNKLNRRPKGLEPLVRNGIPEPLRGEVWQLLSGAHQCADLMERYRIFLTHSAPTEQIILRDIHRTYPAHENFRSGAGSSSLLDSLFKVCKAYAVYDEEVGYCQGLSFLVAALLLHMPEEQAFCVFVRIMQHYGLRNLFRNNFDELYLKFYQLERLLEDNIPDLHQHFSQVGIEPFTYASQWFLTVFTAKFPLNAVFYIMDIFLLDGMNTIFQIALALLLSSKQELLALDFEGVLKYFRVQMPKRYRNQENVQQLISASSEISLKHLQKHTKSYQLAKTRERLFEDPSVRLKRENAKLTENNLRLEQENDDLARDLVASKIQLRAQLDRLEDKVETLNRALIDANNDCRNYKSTISDMDDERARLEVEVSQLKEVCRRELNRAETESARDGAIIADYKKICSQLSKRLDNQVEFVEKFLNSTLDLLQDNDSCVDQSCFHKVKPEFEEFWRLLKTNEEQDSQSSSVSDSETVTSAPTRASNNSDKSAHRPPQSIKSSDSLQSTTSSETKIQQLTQQVDDLEVELARTKLALVEAECKCQQLTHDLSSGLAVKLASSSSGNTNNASGGFSGKLDFVRAAVSSHRSPRVASNALAKINNLISEKISSISQTNQNHVAPAAATKSFTPVIMASPANTSGDVDGKNLNSCNKNDDAQIVGAPVAIVGGGTKVSGNTKTFHLSTSGLQTSTTSNSEPVGASEAFINQAGDDQLQNQC